MGWSKNGTPTTLTSSSDDMDITDLTANIFNEFLIHQISVTDTTGLKVTFNNNSNTVYASREETDGGADVTSTSNTIQNWFTSTANENKFSIASVCSVSGEEKLQLGTFMQANTAGTGNAPRRRLWVGKFVPSPDVDITRIDCNNPNSGSYDIGSNISALGTNGNSGETYSIQDKCVFEETDTNKHYLYHAKTDTWQDLDEVRDDSERKIYDIIPDFEDDFSGTDDWSDSGTQIVVNTTTDVIDWDADSASVHHATAFDLGAGNVSDEKWVLRFNFKLNNKTNSSASQSIFYFGIRDVTVGTTSTSTSQEMIGFYAGVNNGPNNDIGIHYAKDQALITLNETEQAQFGLDQLNTTRRWVEVARENSTTIRGRLYSDPSFKDLLFEIKLNIPSTISGLRYLTALNHTAGDADTLDGTLDGVKFWNDVSQID